MTTKPSFLITWKRGRQCNRNRVSSSNRARICRV